MEKYTRRRISERGCKGDGEHEKKNKQHERKKRSRSHTQTNGVLAHERDEQKWRSERKVLSAF